MAAGARSIVTIETGNLVVSGVNLMRKSYGLLRRVTLVDAHARKFPGAESTHNAHADKSKKY
jgi:hypothetical protein